MGTSVRGEILLIFKKSSTKGNLAKNCQIKAKDLFFRLITEL